MRLKNEELKVWREDAELSFELVEFEGCHSREIQAQDTKQWSLEHKCELKLDKSRVEGRILEKTSI